MGDERLAKWSRVAWENSMDESPEGVHSIKDALMALADSESADLRAALVVVREQLTQARALVLSELIRIGVARMNDNQDGHVPDWIRDVLKGEGS